MRNPVSDMLLELIAERNITQRMLAWKIEMSAVTLNEIISGKTMITNEKAFRVEREFPSFNSREALKQQIDYAYENRKLRYNFQTS